eukprot:XP_001610021.1 T-cell immunomodulatory protein-like protein precursor [Babesia bovis T2Bo]
MKKLEQVLNHTGEIADFGDYNNDGQLDVISYHTNGDKSTVYVHSVPNEANKSTVLAKYEVAGVVDGVIGVDVNLDTALDILVIVKHEDKYYLEVIYQDSSNGKLEKRWNSTEKTNSDTSSENVQVEPGKSPYYHYTSIHPLVLDINGDGYPDFLCQSTENKVYVWINKDDVLIPYLMEKIPMCSFERQIIGHIPSPHSSAFVDLDGDCRPDLVLLVERENKHYLQIWQSYSESNKLKYVSKREADIELPENHGQVSFVDINADGTIDIAVPYCTKSEDKRECAECNKIAMVLNKQKPFCSYIWNNPNSDMCRKANELCTRSLFEFKPLIGESAVTISLPEGFKFYHSKKRPLTLTFGDLNNNGYPDIILMAHDVAKSKSVVIIFKNVDKQDATDIYTRSFEKSVVLEELETGEHEFRVAAVDLFEDGITEIAVFASATGSVGKSIGKFYAVVNEAIGLFMKAMVKSFADAATPSVNVLSTGSNVSGNVFKITVIDVYGTKSPRCSTIRAQSAHSPLLPPYSMFGLGKTNNYVEEFYLGVPSKAESHSNMWISIIPNCSVIAIPHRLFYPNEWTVKLSLSPSKDIYKILIATVICLISLGVVIVGFDLKEKREDSEQEKGFRQNFIIN